MDTSVEGIVVNNCQYTPIYLIQSPSATQANTYVFSSSNVEQSKPISNNLKTFYENSGSIENGLMNIDVGASARCGVRITGDKKKDSVLSGNNLKMENLLLQNNDNVNKQYTIDNIVLKPNNTTSSKPPSVNVVPTKIDIDRKIVKLKELPIINRTQADKGLPKIKPKENSSSLGTNQNNSKHISVQLIKLGGTYHSLNHLSKQQMKIVNKALTIFNDPDNTTLKPTYDPQTNTQYIYKIVSPKDLTVVGRKKMVIKDKKITKVHKKVIEDKVIKQTTHAREVIEPEHPVETKVTRSGRKVKLPKQILTEDSPHKHKKKTGTIVCCLQCSAEFGSLYRLQKHYENHPTHIPTKVHSNLFHCLVAIIKGQTDTQNKTNIFIQQVEQLIVKLKSLSPCLFNDNNNKGQTCTINDDIGRLFGIDSGKYKIDVDALNCVKDKDGFCIHNRPKLNEHSNIYNETEVKHKDQVINVDSESENCARINSVVKWPTVNKRIWRLKHKTNDMSAKKIRHETDTQQTTNSTDNVPVPCTNVQFHSAHFDIRSSPIKSSSTVFRKFQINLSKMNDDHVRAIRPLDMISTDPSTSHNTTTPVSDNSLYTNSETCLNISNDINLANTNTDTDSLNDIFNSRVDVVTTRKELSNIDSDLKEWIIDTNVESHETLSNYTKTDIIIEPQLLQQVSNCAKHVCNDDNITDDSVMSTQRESLLNFLDNLSNELVNTETESETQTEIRNNVVDLHTSMDLFTYHNSV